MTRFVVVFCALIATESLGFAAPPVSEPAPRVAVRGGLGNVRAKLEAGEPVTIAFLGGSITALPGWRDGLTRRWRARYGKDAVMAVNAGLSATGSDVAVFRLDDEVLAHRPDLVIVEFAVNDAEAAPNSIASAVEGIIRKIWTANPRTDIVFVYFFEPKFEELLRDGRWPRSMAAHERLAAHHGIPSIDAASVVAELVGDGDLRLRGARRAAAGTPPAFSRDGVHPHPNGHRIYERAVAAGLEEILTDSTPRDHSPQLERPLVLDHWEAAKRVPLATWMLDEHWRRLPSDATPGTAKRKIDIWESTAAGATLELGFTGRLLKFYEHRPSETGAVELRIDGELIAEESYRRLNAGPALRVLHVRHRFGEDLVHRVSLRVVAPKGGAFRPVRLGDLLVLGEVVP